MILNKKLTEIERQYCLGVFENLFDTLYREGTVNVYIINSLAKKLAKNTPVENINNS
jgi:hypothetical protein